MRSSDMAMVNRTRILIIRAGIMILAFLGIAFLLVISKAILPEGFIGGFIRYGIGVWLFFRAWDFALDFSVRHGESVKRRNRAPKQERQNEDQGIAVSHCTQCGKPAGTADKFCRFCGASIDSAPTRPKVDPVAAKADAAVETSNATSARKVDKNAERHWALGPGMIVVYVVVAMVLVRLWAADTWELELGAGSSDTELPVVVNEDLKEINLGEGFSFYISRFWQQEGADWVLPDAVQNVTVDMTKRRYVGKEVILDVMFAHTTTRPSVERAASDGVALVRSRPNVSNFIYECVEFELRRTESITCLMSYRVDDFDMFYQVLFIVPDRDPHSSYALFGAYMKWSSQQVIDRIFNSIEIQ